MKSMLRKLTLGLAFAVSCLGLYSQQVNPAEDIRWPAITGAGTPTALSIPCAASNYGQPYQNTAVTPNTTYHCSTDGWELNASSGGVTQIIPQSGGNISLSPSGGTGAVTVSASPIPYGINNFFVVGASQDIGFNTQQEGFISSQTAGSGYSGTGTAAVGSLTCATGGGARQPVVNAVTVPGGTGLTYSVSDFGQGCTPGTYTITPSGFTGGSGSTAVFTVYSTPNYPTNWPLILTTMSSLNGKITTFNNYSVTAHTVAQAISDITTNGYLTKCAATGPNYVIVGGDLIRNSIASLNGNIPLSTAYAQWIAFTHVLKANGCIVIVTTPWDNLQLNEGGGNGGATNAQASQLIRNGVKGVDYDLLIDLGGIVLNNTDPTLIAWDNLHPTQSGQYMFAYAANQALLTGNPSTLGNLPNQLVGTTLLVYGNATIGNGTTGALNVTGYLGTTPPVPGAWITWLGTSFNDFLLYSGSTTATAGIFDLKGCTNVPVCTQYMQFSSTGNTSSIQLNASAGLQVSGAVSSSPVSTMTMTSSGGFSAFNSISNTSTAGNFVFNGVTNGAVSTPIFTIALAGSSFGSPLTVSGSYIQNSGTFLMSSGAGALYLQNFPTALSNRASLGFFSNQTLFISASNSATPAGFLFRGYPSTITGNIDYLTISNLSGTWAIPEIVGGTKFTAATGTCGAATSTTGNGTVGIFVLAANGPCTQIITVNGVTGMTATNGWKSTGITDRTTTAANTAPGFAVLTSTTTTATITVPTGALLGDTVDFGLSPF